MIDRKLEGLIEVFEETLRRFRVAAENGGKMTFLDEMRGEVGEKFEEMEKCRDILKKLRETDQIYIDHDVPLSISKHLFSLLDARRGEDRSVDR